MFNIWLDYPEFDEEVEIVKSTTSLNKPEINKVLTGEQIIVFQDLVRKVPVSDNVIDFAVKLVRSTRPDLQSPVLSRTF